MKLFHDILLFSVAMTEITKLHYFDEHKLKGSTTFHLSFNLHVPDDTEQIVVGIVR